MYPACFVFFFFSFTLICCNKRSAEWNCDHGAFSYDAHISVQCQLHALQLIVSAQTLLADLPKSESAFVSLTLLFLKSHCMNFYLIGVCVLFLFFFLFQCRRERKTLPEICAQRVWVIYQKARRGEGTPVEPPIPPRRTLKWRKVNRAEMANSSSIAAISWRRCCRRNT